MGNIDSKIPDPLWRIDADLDTVKGILDSAACDDLPPQPVLDAELAPRPTHESLSTLVACELLAIAAVMILVFIEARHSQYLTHWLCLALVGATSVIGLTLYRWYHDRRSRDQARQIPPRSGWEDVSSPMAVRPTSYYRRIAEASQPTHWS